MPLGVWWILRSSLPLGRRFLDRDLAAYLEPAENSSVSFVGKYPADFFSIYNAKPVACHLVGGKDLLSDDERTGDEPDDGVSGHPR